MAASEPIVRLTTSAAVKGYVRTATEKLREVYCFAGVPYAAPPARFKPPKPLQLWDGIRDCTQFGSICPQDKTLLKKQYGSRAVPSNFSEDCLFLNVFTPIANNRAKLPVMVWIHGGAFSMGFSDFYDGTSLCNFNDVVIVTLNYRLGPLGFLSTGDDVIKGNMGLLDQLEALRWVQKYIAAFGGDSKNVTIFGESAGGISISYHMLSPLSKGLFHKAICQSGVSTYPGSSWSPETARKYLLTRLHKKGFKSRDSKEIAKYLEAMPIDELLSLGGGFIYAVVDGDYLTDFPKELYKQDKFNKNVDVMLGFNSHEGALFVLEMIGKNNVNSLDKALRQLDVIVDQLFFRKNPNSKKIKEFIFDEYLKNAADQEGGYLKGLIDIYGDLLFVAPTHYVAHKHATKGSGNTFLYKFMHKLLFPVFPSAKYEWLGADHGGEIVYVFGEPFLGRFPDIWTTDDKEISKNIMKLWTQFAKSGNPNGVIVAEWPQHSEQGDVMMLLKPDFQLLPQVHEPKRTKLWNETIEKLATRKVSKY